MSYTVEEIRSACKQAGYQNYFSFGDGNFCLYLQNVKGALITIMYKTIVANSAKYKETIKPYLTIGDKKYEFKDTQTLFQLLEKMK